MADSAVAVTAGSGTNIDTRTEGTNGNHRAVVVLGDPATNAGVAPVDATAGLKVDLGADNDITGTVTANLSATDNAVLDSIDTSTQGILADTAAIQTAVELIDNAISGTEMQVDVVGALPAGTNAIGKLAANSGVDIGDVDVTSLPGVAAEAAALGSGVLLQGDDGTDRKNVNVDATTGDVQVDVTNTVTVDGSGVTQPVSGTVTANLSATDNAVLDSIDTSTQGILADTAAIQTAVEIIDNAIAGSEMQVDVVAALPAGTNAIGKLAANSGVDIGDVDVTSISAGTNLIGDVGISGARTSGGTTLYKNIDVDESEDQVKGTAGQVYWIHAINLTAAPLYLKFYNATAASVTVGTTTPDLTFPVPGNADSDGAGFTLSIPNGIAFSTAITIAGTTGVADADTGAPGANALIVNLGYA